MRHILTIICLLTLASCVPFGDRVLGDITLGSQEEPLDEEARFTVEGTEGDLIVLYPQAEDPDDDDVTYTFATPFDDKGQWQTQLGDEGTYYTTVTADDSRGGFATETVEVLVHHKNRKPVIDCQQHIVITEGERVDLYDYCTITDEDTADLRVAFTGWMNSHARQTGYDDEGAHEVTIHASDFADDEPLTTEKDIITIVVQNANRPPEFNNFPELVAATENDVVTLPLGEITDPDGDKVRVTFSDPFGKNGVWKTEVGDAGVYDVDVVASDGTDSVKKTVRVNLGFLNTKPTVKPIADIVVSEGELVEIPVEAFDRESEDLYVQISGWMDTVSYQTTYDDAGEYTVKVTVSDGSLEESQVVNVIVEDRNRPPYFTVPA
ncbi:MAG: hypothetical protein OXR66_05220 [Candidatus Woesearchaeota archaeon]|nr:hypothetical protein [Candidatus Woesearchaeota archaeon]